MGSRLEKNSNQVRKRIESHSFTDEGGEEYEPSAFGGFPDYFRRKKIKLQNLDAEIRASTTKPQIFKGIVAHVTGYTQPPLHVLHKDLVEHGAAFIQYLDSKTMATHIIASTLPPKKMVDFNKYRIVKPAWVTDSIQAGKLLPWSNYRVIGETPRQKTLKFDGGVVSSQSNTQQSSLLRYREQTDNSFYTSQLKDIAEKIDGKQTRHQTPTTNQTPPTFEPPRGRSSPLFANDATLPPRKLVEVAVHVSMDLAELDEAAVGDLDMASDNKPEDFPSSPRPPNKPLGEMTSEEHNALLLQDPRMRKSSTANPDFIQQYYSESRLHHLSTWKADLKSRMQKLAAEKGLQARPAKRKPGTRRYIMHVDFDSFFCAVSLKSAPEFVDKPAVVAHGSGTGSEIASCNYPARKFGVKNGMWMKKAKELCPDLKVLPYDFPAYEAASQLFYEAILEVGGVVQSVSIDEALIDVSSLIFAAVGSQGGGVDEGSIWREQEKADQIAQDLRDRIKSKTGCAVSIGIGDNILLAKVALRKAKPAGQFQLKPEAVLSFLGDLKADDLPGVAYSITGKLQEIGIVYVKDVREVSKERLVTALGPKTGEKLFEYARGIDRVEVGDQPIRKSVSAEVNWGIRFINQEEAEEFIFNLCKELERRLVNEQVKGKQLTMKIMRRSLDAPLDPPKHLGHGKCDTFNKSIVFGIATHNHRVIGKEAVSILRSYNFSPGDLRGLGIQLTKLEPVKISISGGPESSQKKLNFGGFRTPASAKKPTEDLIQEVDSPVKPSPTPGHSEGKDPIDDDPLTPRKPKHSTIHAALAISKACENDAKANTPLNIGGTQFVLPANPDPAVLAELPPDIRNKLLAQSKPKFESRKPPPAVRSRAQSPALVDEIPPDIDPEVFAALPDDLKAEILASYRPRAGQHLLPQSPRKARPLPQSPRKDRIIQQTKKSTPTKKRGPGLFANARERHADAQNKVVQTSLAFNPGEDAGDGDMEELDAEFLAGLPESVRKEVIDDHRRRRAQRAGLDLRISNKRQRELEDRDRDEDGDEDEDEIKLQFNALPAKVAFTNAELTSLSDIRDMLNVWHKETATEGPHQRDVEMLGTYLVRVVLEERDMDKAKKLVQWLDYIVEENETDSSGKTSWRGVVRSVKSEVQKAARQRGLGPLDM
ncbi:impB/mucB/samB family protein [Truncatella angustata]|uniref:DNA repair protein REV1 n=1 Tax=Truncatella angustata TaxID=152316 RepID=A0A9P8UX95_9PEZI|nr:impB/mucB/samB family protein [Truncatella angustata]KAH6660055.1 impB/mucB/samB family protein [Truncatella angustata]